MHAKAVHTAQSNEYILNNSNVAFSYKVLTYGEYYLYLGKSLWIITLLFNGFSTYVNVTGRSGLNIS